MSTAIAKPTEAQIYSNYRSALRSATQIRAAARRQHAREVTVSRYNVPYAEVKRIVSKFDAESNITHEHTEDSLQRFALIAAEEAFNAEPTPCPDCGSEDMVRVRVDVYAEEVYGKFALTTSCFLCYRERLRDI